MNPTSLSLLQTITATDNSLSHAQKSILQDLIAGRLPRPSLMPDKLLLTQKEAAKLLNISCATLWRMTKDGIFNLVEVIRDTFPLSSG